MGRIFAVLFLTALFFGAIALACAPGDAQSEPSAPSVQSVATCAKVSPERFNAALKVRRNLGGPKPKQFAHKPVCIRPHYRKLKAQIKRLRRCQRSNVCIGRIEAAKRGWTGTQFGCLRALWGRESGWSTTADNPHSEAYGIPQALPGSKMASHGSDWRTNPRTQIRWGLSYIDGRYGTPCNADSTQRSQGWY